MAEINTSVTDNSGTAMVCFAEHIEPPTPLAAVRHDAPYVTQLLAYAADLPNVPQRRRTDRTAPLQAYTSIPLDNGRIRRIV